MDLNFDGAAIFGGDRSKRYVLKIEDGAVKEAHVEPDNTGLNGLSPIVFALYITRVLCQRLRTDLNLVSAADKVL